MVRYLFELAYDGSAFYGWQRQPKQLGIQEVIENALSDLHSKAPIAIVGCGRTDAGVHAHQYFFHSDLPHSIDEAAFLFKLNRMLPPSIVIYSIKASDIHARFDAINRSYRYFIHKKKNPFQRQYSLHYPQALNFDQMNEAAQLLLGRHDFTSFSKLHTDVTNNFCEVFSAQWVVTDREIYFEISANRFLRNMVRATVGTLLEVGLGKMTLAEFKAVIASKDRGKAAVSVPGHALFLWEINY